MKNSESVSSYIIRSLFFLCVAMILLGLAIGFVPWYHQKTAAAVNINGYFLYDETVLSLPERGKLLPCYPQGTRVGRGETAALYRRFALNGASCDALRAPMAGQVYYRTDGLEDILVLGRVENLSATELLAEAAKKNYGTEVGVKIVNNHAPVFLAGVFTKNEADAVTEGDIVALCVGGIDTQGSVLKKFRDQGEIVCIFRLTAEEDWFRHRFVPVSLGL